jgi:hypothetical protein
MSFVRPVTRVVVTEIQTKDKDGKVRFVATEVRLGSANALGPK